MVSFLERGLEFTAGGGYEERPSNVSVQRRNK